VVEFQDYHACEGGISLDEYGYASDSDLDDDDDEETDETVQDSKWLHSSWHSIPSLDWPFEDEDCAEVSTERASRTASIKNSVTKGVQRIIPSRRILVTDTAFTTCGLPT